MTFRHSKPSFDGFRRQRLRMNSCLVAMLALVLLAPVAGAQSATIVATDSVNIRTCPSLDCEVVASASLGDDVQVTGDPVDGFVPVTYRAMSGFAFGLFLSSATGDPWFTHGQVGCKRVALIFNIGIGETPSQTVLDTLVNADVDATMFPMGWWAEKEPEYVHRLSAEGFTIGTHGQNNLFLTDATDEEVRADLLASVDSIARITGQPIAPWATPYAADSDARVRRIIASLGYMPVGWSVSAADYDATATRQSVLDNVLPNISDGAIVEFHLDGPATESSTALALPEIIDSLRVDGYSLVTVPDLALPCTPPA